MCRRDMAVKSRRQDTYARCNHIDFSTYYVFFSTFSFPATSSTSSIPSILYTPSCENAGIWLKIFLGQMFHQGPDIGSFVLCRLKRKKIGKLHFILPHPHPKKRKSELAPTTFPSMVERFFW